MELVRACVALLLLLYFGWFSIEFSITQKPCNAGQDS